jgi:predicted transposase YdaD
MDNGYFIQEEEEDGHLVVRESEIRQANQYDKVIRENLEDALPGLIEKVLKIETVYTEELPDDLQFTKERKPDLLKKVKDIDENIYILHIEFQTGNSKNMAFRMVEYFIMLTRRYKLPVRQYVIYMGRKKLSMKGELDLQRLHFSYDLLDLSTVDYHLLLHSEKPAEMALAVLCDFGKEDPAAVITRITTEVIRSSKDELERQQRKNQLRILLQLRKLAPENIQIMESVSTFFKKENDFLYCMGKNEGKMEGKMEGKQEGEKAGIEKGKQEGREESKAELVKKLLLQTDFTITKIADLTDVTEDFVNKVKNTLN